MFLSKTRPKFYDRDELIEEAKPFVEFLELLQDERCLNKAEEHCRIVYADD